MTRFRGYLVYLQLSLLLVNLLAVMRATMTSWLALLLLLTAVFGISCLHNQKSRLQLRPPTHIRHSPNAIHSVEPGLTKDLNYNRVERDVIFNHLRQRVRRDVPASSYSFSPPDDASVRLISLPETNVEIIEEKEENDYNGTFTYSFEAANGISVEMKGYPKTLSSGMVVQVMAGQYSYTAPDGTPITTRWYADETGFHAEGAHIPGSTGRT